MSEIRTIERSRTTLRRGRREFLLSTMFLRRLKILKIYSFTKPLPRSGGHIALNCFVVTGWIWLTLMHPWVPVFHAKEMEGRTLRRRLDMCRVQPQECD